MLSNQPLQKDFRVQELPLARIKKIMKLDEDVKVQTLLKFHFWFMPKWILECYLLLNVSPIKLFTSIINYKLFINF